MFKRTILSASLVGIAATSVVLVVVVIQAPPRRDDGKSAASRFASGGTATAADRAVGQIRPEEFQGGGLEEIQAKIHASDEEWKVIGPKLRRLMVAYATAEVSFDASTMSSTGEASQTRSTAFGGPDPGFAPPGRWGPGGPGEPGGDSFASPGDGGPFGRGGPGPAGFGRGGPGPDGFGPGPGGFGRGGRGPGGFGRGGPGPGGGPPGFGGPGGNAVAQKLTELRTALADPNSTSEQLKEKLGAVRDARLKAKAELAVARKDLLELLTPDQEAVLVSLNYLD